MTTFSQWSLVLGLWAACPLTATAKAASLWREGSVWQCLAHTQSNTAQPYTNSLIATAESQPDTSHGHFQLSEDSEEHLTQNIPIWSPRSRDHVSCCVLTALPLCSHPLHHVCIGDIGPSFQNQKNFPKTVYCFQSKNICIHTTPWPHNIAVLRTVSWGPRINMGDAGVKNTWKFFPIYLVIPYRVYFFTNYSEYPCVSLKF